MSAQFSNVFVDQLQRIIDGAFFFRDLIRRYFMDRDLVQSASPMETSDSTPDSKSPAGGSAAGHKPARSSLWTEKDILAIGTCARVQAFILLTPSSAPTLLYCYTYQVTA